jgi:hypothetical protein
MTRKILFSLLVIGAVVAAFGAITYAIFSDNIASDVQEFAAGTVNIEIYANEAWYEELFDTTLDMDNMEPGDCSEQLVVVHNKGSLPVDLWNWIYTWHVPSGPPDPPNIFNCDPNPACNMKVWKEFVSDDFDQNDEKLYPDCDLMPPAERNPGVNCLVGGEHETWRLKACLPLCAGNSCQGGTGQMRIFFHAVQQSNLDGYECVKLEDKGPPDWIPDPTTLPHGNVCYKAIDTGTNGLTDALHIIVNAYGLKGNADFQLALDGGDTNDPHDAGCTGQDDDLASMCGSPRDLYTCGYWNWGASNLSDTCQASNGGEGVWNYAGVYGGVHSDGTGASDGTISYDATLSGLPARTYTVKANVKEITGAPPGTAWTSVLTGLDYLQFTIDE